MNLCTFFIKPRSWRSFEHKKRKSELWSQNLEQVRTQKAGNRESESEPGLTSDTKNRKARVRDRTWSNFGHKRQENESQSQNLL